MVFPKTIYPIYRHWYFSCCHGLSRVVIACAVVSCYNVYSRVSCPHYIVQLFSTDNASNYSFISAGRSRETLSHLWKQRGYISSRSSCPSKTRASCSKNARLAFHRCYINATRVSRFCNASLAFLHRETQNLAFCNARLAFWQRI